MPVNVNERFEISMSERYAVHSMPMPHTHSFYELYYVVSGQCEFIADDISYTMVPDSVYIISQNIPHQTIYTDDKVVRFNIEFSENYLTNLITYFGYKRLKDTLLNQHIQMPDYAHNPIENIARSMIEDNNSDDIYSDFSKRLAFEGLLVYIMRNRTTFFDSISNGVAVTDESVKKALVYIENNYHHPINLANIAELNHLNPSYFSVKFKQITGRNFKDYITMVRISHSEKYLLETNKSITEISFLCGFENSNYYGDVFKKIHKVSPSEFRKNKGQIY